MSNNSQNSMVVQIYLNAEEKERYTELANAEGMDIKKFAKKVLLSYKTNQEKRELATLIYKATTRALEDFSAKDDGE